MPQPLKALIVDDEKNARENLALMLEDHCPHVVVVGLAEDIDQAEVAIAKHQPDVVFLDIRMPSGSEGFELLHRIPNRQFLVVFVTAFRDFALEAFHANAIHYLLKPIDIGELIGAVNKVGEQSLRIKGSTHEQHAYQHQLESLVANWAGAPRRLAISHQKGIKMISTDEIIFLEAEGNYTTFHLSAGRTFIDTRTIKTYEQMLPAKQFLRTHRSYMVNLDKVDQLLRDNGNWLSMKNGDKVPVSRQRLSAVLTALSTV